jgi:hypothetical protein
MTQGTYDGDGHERGVRRMNYTKAACGHLIFAIGAPGSDARQKCERLPCDDCRCIECDGEGQYDTGGFEPWGSPINAPCTSCNGSGMWT